MAGELKPCPFCGGNAVEYGESLIHSIHCDGCGAGVSMVAGNVYGGIAEVCAKLREKWNRRVTDGVDRLDSKTKGEQ